MVKQSSTSRSMSILKRCSTIFTDPRDKVFNYGNVDNNNHKWFGQFVSAVDSARLSDNVKFTYLKTFVTEKAKNSIAEFAYPGEMHKVALNTNNRKFVRPQTIANAHLEKLNWFPLLKMHKSNRNLCFASTISKIVDVFKALSYTQDLEDVALLNQELGELPPSIKESRALHTVKRSLYQTSLFHFNKWLTEKVGEHDRMCANTSKNVSLHQEIRKIKKIRPALILLKQ